MGGKSKNSLCAILLHVEPFFYVFRPMGGLFATFFLHVRVLFLSLCGAFLDLPAPPPLAKTSAGTHGYTPQPPLIFEVLVILSGGTLKSVK